MTSRGAAAGAQPWQQTPDRYQSECSRGYRADEEVRKNVNDVSGLQLTSNPDCNAFTGELIAHVEHAVFLSVVSTILHEVV
jgi:hypothetical protein